MDTILAHFGSEPRVAASRYRSFAGDAPEAPLWRDLRGQIYLGSEEFVALACRLPSATSNEIPRAQRYPARTSLSVLEREYGDRTPLVAYRDFGYLMREIAQHLGCHTSTVSLRLRALEGQEDGVRDFKT